MVNVTCLDPYRDAYSGRIRGKVVVIFDVFRASTTIICALYKGFKKIVPVKGKMEGIDLARSIGAYSAGEDKGYIIEGYDLSISPFDMLKLHNMGEYLVLRTSNGTRAVKGLETGNVVLIGSTVNAFRVAKVAYKLAEDFSRDILLVAVGTKFLGGEIPTFEDRLGAGLVCYYLKKMGANVSENCGKLLRLVKFIKPIRDFLNSRPFKWLANNLGFEKVRDMVVVSWVNSIPLVPILSVDKNGFKSFIKYEDI